MSDFELALFCVGGISLAALFIFLHKGRFSRIEILRRGVRTQGEVTELDMSGFDLLYRLPTVRFKIGNGQYVTLTAFEKVRVGELEKGQKVEVCYLPEAPDQFIIVSGMDVFIASKTQTTARRPHRLAKGQVPQVKRRQ